VLKGNKGEWSEIYTLLKILADKKLYAGDQHLNKINELVLPIIKVLRCESDGSFEFSYYDDLVVICNNNQEFKIPIYRFKDNAKFLLDKLKEKTKSTFDIPEIKEFINSFNCKTLKAKSSNKSDIKIVVHDQRNNKNTELGFSIKSQLGSPSTLLNAGKTTNFVYKIANLDVSKIEEINSINTYSKVKDRLIQIINQKGSIQFDQIENKIFENNLSLIDSALPQIIANLMLIVYTSKFSKISDLTNEITNKNPLKFNLENNHPFYSYKIKRFLTDIALGMTPAKIWTGKLEATGGYLVVKQSGDIVCYHIYNRNEFEDYLFANTRIITPSTSRYDFGYIYQEKNSLYLKLSLQIRFIK